jgi:hypothetical protein
MFDAIDPGSIGIARAGNDSAASKAAAKIHVTATLDMSVLQ